MDDIPTSPEEALFAAGRGANETADEAMDYSEKVMGGAALFGGGEGAAALLAGGGAELGAGAAAAGGATIGAAVVGSFAAGYGIGTKIDEWTGASDKLSTAAVDVDPERALSAANDWDDAGAAWDRGDHLEAVGDGASAIGKFALSTGEAAVDALGDAASAVGDALFGGPSMMDVFEEAKRRAAEED
jgi:hypothetical protein